LLVSIAPVICFSYEVPRDDTRAEYLYVFGPQGNKYLGAEDVDHEQIVFVNVPENALSDVVIDVYDPDTGGSRDLKPSPESKWDTAVEFSVYGESESPLASKTFAESSEFDKRYYTFGPFKKETGKKVDSGYQFKLMAKALEGSDQNLFKLRVSPENAETFSDKISFRLLPDQGDKMYFYAQLPAGVNSIVAENYDLDPDGGIAVLEDSLTGKVYKVAGSSSAQWASTPIDLLFSDQPRRVVYSITKKTQRYANAAVRLKDDKGNILPLYYAMGRQAVALPRRISPPAVKASPELKCDKYTFDATGSYDQNREKISYLWDFGDGTTSTEPVVTHVYEKGGEYTVTLTVKDTSGLECDTSTSSQKIKVNTPPQANFTGPEAACTGSAVTFDAGVSTDDTPDALTYSWDFGDGTKAEGKTANKTYAKGGTYQVRLYVNDNAGTICSAGMIAKTITVNSPPVAAAGKSIDMCFAANQDIRVAFDGSSSYDPDEDALTYNWDFGDGETATGDAVTHVFSNPGTYTVALTVNDGRNATCSSITGTLTARLNRKPVANASKDIVACAGSTVIFDGSLSQGDDLKYAWDFGDGETAEGSSVTHTYAKGGHYKAVLTVDDGKGTRCSTSSSAVTVFVNSAPAVTLTNEAAACAGTAVKFDASAQDPEGNSLAYTWDFGDGTVMKGGAAQSHQYAKGGEYTVKVTVDDKQGTDCSLASATSQVKINSRPVANAGPNLVCCVDKESFFDGSASSDPDADTLAYHWSFGDGGTQEGAKTTHTYTKSGRYTVTLRVDDGTATACSSATSSFEARVNEKPVSVIKVK
jgi:PKD repeat protein